MTLRKWRSNSQELLESIPQELKETECVQLISPPEECHKALGTLTFHIATPVLDDHVVPIKRQIASDVAQTFDLLGWYVPSVIVIKVLFQKLWKLGVVWDEPVPEEIAAVWRGWKKDLQFPGVTFGQRRRRCRYNSMVIVTPQIWPMVEWCT